MPYTLNTAHPLHANLIELIGVQGGALVSHKTPRTFTKHASATYGTGTWGEHFKTGAKGWSRTGATFTPSISYDTTGGVGFTIFYAVNNIAVAADNLGALHQGATTYGVSTSGQRAITGNSSPDPFRPLTTVGVGAKSICVTRTGDVSNKSYIDGILEYTGGRLGWNEGSTIASIGGYDAQGVAGGIEFVWVAAFNKVLSDAEVLDLHNSLAAGNAFGLITAGAAVDATAPGATLTGTSTLTPGAAAGGASGSASATGATLTGTATLTPGSATGGTAPTTGSFTIPEPLENNAGSLWLGQPVAWTWTPAGRVGSMAGKTPVDGTGTTHATSGLLTMSGLPLGAGQCDIAVLGATPADDAVYRTYGTVV